MSNKKTPRSEAQPGDSGFRVSPETKAKLTATSVAELVKRLKAAEAERQEVLGLLDVAIAVVGIDNHVLRLLLREECQPF